MPLQSCFAVSSRSSSIETRFIHHHHCLNRAAIEPSVYAEETQFRSSQMNQAKAI